MLTRQCLMVMDADYDVSAAAKASSPSAKHRRRLSPSLPEPPLLLRPARTKLVPRGFGGEKHDEEESAAMNDSGDDGKERKKNTHKKKEKEKKGRSFRRTSERLRFSWPDRVPHDGRREIVVEEDTSEPGSVATAKERGWTSSSEQASSEQTECVQSGTVRDNILFGLEIDQERNKAVIEAYALRADLRMFPAGDQTERGGKWCESFGYDDIRDLTGLKEIGQLTVWVDRSSE
ncbi:hypothetical protein BJ742DRAFT_770181 [Cladochytrium replicatum]|nr:hypothetical protein BJ742DRAFT_770181 [Cladochytrium replicatum]